VRAFYIAQAQKDHLENIRVIVKPNSVTFRSTAYKKDKAMIVVRW